jgi:putative flippase GtrA
VALTDIPRTESLESLTEPYPAMMADGPSVGWSEDGSRRALLVQFLQFCLVGAFSTALNELLFNLFLARRLDLNLSYVLAFCIAVTNGFFLNRSWTFRRSRASKMQRQYTMFFAVNIVGLGLSWAVMRVVGAWLLHTGWAQSEAALLQQLTHHSVDPVSFAHSLGVLAATPPCAVWNFGANKIWTFRGARRHG